MLARTILVGLAVGSSAVSALHIHNEDRHAFAERQVVTLNSGGGGVVPASLATSTSSIAGGAFTTLNSGGGGAIPITALPTTTTARTAGGGDSGAGGSIVTLGSSGGGAIPASLFTASTAQSSGGGYTGSDCTAICRAVCPIRAGATSQETRACQCTQAYIDSQYTCLACNAAVYGDERAQQDGVDFLKTLQQGCAQDGYPGLTTQDGLATFNPASTVFGSAASTASSGTTPTTSPANSGAPVAGVSAGGSQSAGGGQDAPGAGFKFQAVSDTLIVSGVLIASLAVFL